MSDFNFNCPKCRQGYCCNDRDREEIFQCQHCRHVFIPADALRKRCPACGEKVFAHAVKCPYCEDFFDAPEKKTGIYKLLKTIFQFLVAVVLISGVLWGWEKYLSGGRWKTFFPRKEMRTEISDKTAPVRPMETTPVRPMETTSVRPMETTPVRPMETTSVHPAQAFLDLDIGLDHELKIRLVDGNLVADPGGNFFGGSYGGVGTHGDLKHNYPDLYFGYPACRANGKIWKLEKPYKLRNHPTRIVKVELLESGRSPVSSEACTRNDLCGRCWMTWGNDFISLGDHGISSSRYKIRVFFDR